MVEGVKVVKAAARVGAMSAEAGGMDRAMEVARLVARTFRKHDKWRRTGAQPRRVNNGRELPWTRKSGQLWSDRRNSERIHGQVVAVVVAAVAAVAVVAAAAAPTSSWRRPCCRLPRGLTVRLPHSGVNSRPAVWLRHRHQQ